MICAVFIRSAHSDSDNRCSAHGEHGCDGNNKGDERNSDIDSTQGSRAYALPYKNTVYNIVKIGYKRAAQCREDVTK